MKRQTIFSPCRRYRYTLWRELAEADLFNPRAQGYANFICLNPSTADEIQDDPTIRRCVDFTRRWGYGSFCMTNLFAWRATDPKEMKAQRWPVGDDNLEHLLAVARGAEIVIVAWGKHGRHIKQDANVSGMLADHQIRMWCLKRNDDGTPVHPLYQPSTSEPQIYQP